MTDTETYDPFGEFSAVAGTDRDPYPEFAERRRTTPVWEGALTDHSMLPPEFRPAKEYHCFTYDGCARILRDEVTFTSNAYNDTMGLVMGKMILGMGGPEHRAHRNLVSSAFRQKSLARWEPELVEPICHELIDSFADAGEAELVEQLTFEFPIRVIARLLGLPAEDYQEFQRLSIQLIGIAGNIEKGLEASVALKEHMSRMVADRRQHPQDDIISDLVTAEVDGQRLTDEEIYPFLLLLLPAGAETTFRSSGNLIYLLLHHPEQLQAIRDDRSLLPQAIEEGLRYETPLLSIQRTATCEVELEGVTIPEGASVGPCLGSANRDEKRWDNADRFDIFRPAIPHLSFAHGPHLCLGLHLARLETRVLMNALLDRVTDIRLLDRGDPHIRGRVFRSPTSLPVTFVAA